MSETSKHGPMKFPSHLDEAEEPEAGMRYPHDQRCAPVTVPIGNETSPQQEECYHTDDTKVSSSPSCAAPGTVRVQNEETLTQATLKRYLDCLTDGGDPQRAAINEQ